MPVVVAAYGKWDGKGLERAQRDLDKLKRQAGNAGSGISSSIGKAGAAIGRVGAAAAVAGAAVSVKIGKDSVKAASDFNEVASKSKVLFGESATAIEKWADSAAKRIGQSKTQAMDSAATFAVFGKSAGLSGKDLTKFSTGFTELASDMASFSNTTPEEAIEAIGAALRGENEPIRKYGVLLDDNSLKQEALRQGIIKTTKQALTPQQKILAAQGIIYRQTGDAQGDFARTSDGLANQQRILTAQWEDAKAKIGNALLPAVLKIVTAFNNNLVPAMSWVKDAFEKVRPSFEKVQTALSDLWTQISTALGPMIKEFVQDIGPKFKVTLEQWAEAFSKAAPFIKDVVIFVAGLIGGLIQLGIRVTYISGVVVEKFGALYSGVKSWLTKAGKTVTDTTATIKEAFTGLADKAKGWGKNLISEFIDGIKSKIGALGDSLKGAAKKVKDYLGFSSPTKEGPGSTADKWAPNLMKMYAGGIMAGLPMVQSAVSQVAGTLNPSGSLAFAGAGGTTGTRSVSVALTINAPGATSDTVAGLNAAGTDLLAALAREVRRG